MSERRAGSQHGLNRMKEIVDTARPKVGSHREEDANWNAATLTWTRCSPRSSATGGWPSSTRRTTPVLNANAWMSARKPARSSKPGAVEYETFRTYMRGGLEGLNPSVGTAGEPLHGCPRRRHHFGRRRWLPGSAGLPQVLVETMKAYGGLINFATSSRRDRQPLQWPTTTAPPRLPDHRENTQVAEVETTFAPGPSGLHVLLEPGSGLLADLAGLGVRPGHLVADAPRYPLVARCAALHQRDGSGQPTASPPASRSLCSPLPATSGC